MSVTMEERPSRHGVVRAIARSDHWRWVSTPISLSARPTDGTGLPRWSGGEEPGIEAQPRDHRRVRLYLIEPFDGGVGVVSHDNDLPLGKPAPELKDHLPGPVERRLVPQAGALGIPFRGRRRGQERQRPDSAGPGNWGEQHEREPPKPARFDEVAVARPYRTTVDP